MTISNQLKTLACYTAIGAAEGAALSTIVTHSDKTYFCGDSVENCYFRHFLGENIPLSSGENNSLDCREFTKLGSLAAFSLLGAGLGFSYGVVKVVFANYGDQFAKLGNFVLHRNRVKPQEKAE